MKQIITATLGIFALMLLFFFCIPKHVTNIQKDISQRVFRDLSDRGMPWARVSVDGRNIKLSGVSPSLQFKQKAGQVASTTWGVGSIDNNLAVDPRSLGKLAKNSTKDSLSNHYKTSFTKAGGVITLSGQVTNDNSRRLLVDLAKKITQSPDINDQLTIDEQSPEGWLGAAIVAMSSLEQVKSGQATLLDQSFDLVGITSPITTDKIREQIKTRLPTNFVTSIKLVPPKDAANGSTTPKPSFKFCLNQFNHMLIEKKINFSTSGTFLSERSKSTLDQLVAFTQICPGSRVEISGHTDSRGRHENNLSLGQSRSSAVIEFLITKGVKRELLIAASYGSSNPIADNATEVGRATNRRVEFQLVK